jgi:hypothetical protein
MKKLHDDDYLIEITIRLAVHKKDAAAWLSIAGPPYFDDSEEDRIMSTVSDFVDNPQLLGLSRIEHSAYSHCPTLR